MLTCQLSGGLGNQLNQIAYIVIQSDILQIDAVFDPTNYTKLTQGNFEVRYKQSIFRKIKWQSLDGIGATILDLEPIADTKLFDAHRDRLIKLFKPPLRTIAKLNHKYHNVLDSNNCAIHVRRGDLAQFPGYCKILSPDYYQDAINKLDRDTKFLIFSDDLNYCRKIFVGDRFFFSEETDDDLDLYLMSMCYNQIIANSTYSWWGAFLNQNPGKIVLRPI